MAAAASLGKELWSPTPEDSCWFWAFIHPFRQESGGGTEPPRGVWKQDAGLPVGHPWASRGGRPGWGLVLPPPGCVSWGKFSLDPYPLLPSGHEGHAVLGLSRGEGGGAGARAQQRSAGGWARSQSHAAHPARPHRCPGKPWPIFVQGSRPAAGWHTAGGSGKPVWGKLSGTVPGKQSSGPCVQEATCQRSRGMRHLSGCLHTEFSRHLRN